MVLAGVEAIANLVLGILAVGCCSAGHLICLAANAEGVPVFGAFLDDAAFAEKRVLVYADVIGGAHSVVFSAGAGVLAIFSALGVA